MQIGKIEVEQNTFKILGWINFATVTRLHKQGIELFAAAHEVRLDFSEVEQVDSSVIALLLNWLRLGKREQKKFVFLNLPRQCIEMANVCEVMPFLNPYIATDAPSVRERID